jgi:hypothetical protein
MNGRKGDKEGRPYEHAVLQEPINRYALGQLEYFDWLCKS